MRVLKQRAGRVMVAGFICGALIMATQPNPAQAQQTEPAMPRSNAAGAPLTVTPQGFLLNGKPFRLLSGELEYARIPRADWRDRLQKARALGLNAVTVYVFWDLHEPKPGQFDFSDQNDVAEFIREAQRQGLYVVLRPGPYACAEWDLGGYPAWLLKDHTMLLRSNEPAFMEAATRWMHRLGEELAPLQASRGGPILAVQVENEYGSFGDDRTYMEALYRLVRDSGFTGSLLYTADGADVIEKGHLPGVFTGIDFGTGDARRSIDMVKRKQPGWPVYVAEYWDGWFDHWGAEHQTTDAARQEQEIGTMLAEGDSLSLYMVHGGTSFGWMNGANHDKGGYQPDVSSYDYDAPLDESGRPRPKYFALREVIAKATGETPPPVPASAPMLTFPAIALTQARSLWEGLPAGLASASPLSMEDMDQAYGYALYRTEIDGSGPAELAFHDLHSYARLYLDGRWVGTVDRRLGQQTITLDATGKHRLDILVENSGRINFSQALRGERAGLTGEVTLGGKALLGWRNIALPFDPPPQDGFSSTPCTGPCFYRASFQLDHPGDTFLNTEALGKGAVWVNGHLLGRAWSVGPMGSLFLPGAWLRKGENRVEVLDLNGGTGLSIAGQDHPTYLKPKPENAPGR